MPSQFPDMTSLRHAAQIHHFRAPLPEEPEESYRALLADHVETIDFVEGQEIRNKVGWDEFSDAQNVAMLTRRVAQAQRKEGPHAPEL